jgi:hypothetical protein
VDKEAKIRLRTENEGKAWDVATVEIFPNTIDLALVTFKPDTQRCHYPALTTGNSESLRKGSSIFIYGFPSRGEQPVAQFVDGKVSGFDKLARGYGVSYRTLTVGGMSGAPVVDRSSKVVAVHGMSDTEIVQSLASQKAGLSESEQELSQEAEESLKMASIERLTFSWAVPIAFFRESKFYYPQLSELSLWLFFSVGAIFGGGIVYFGLRYFQTPQVSGQRQKELERQLRDEQRRGKELEERLSSLQNQKTQAQQELERQLEWEKGKRQEVEAQLQRQGQVQPPVREPQSSGDVPLVSAVGVDYTKLRNLLVAKNWKEADLETGKRMLEVAGRESQGWLFSEDVENFPCQDLGTIIDKL